MEGVDKDGNTKHAYHIRLKGISPAAIEDHVKKERENNSSYDEFELYKRLFGGEAVQFNMKVNNKVRFQKSKDQEFYTYSGNSSPHRAGHENRRRSSTHDFCVLKYFYRI